MMTLAIKALQPETDTTHGRERGSCRGREIIVQYARSVLLTRGICMAADVWGEFGLVADKVEMVCTDGGGTSGVRTAPSDMRVHTARELRRRNRLVSRTISVLQNAGPCVALQPRPAGILFA